MSFTQTIINNINNHIHCRRVSIFLRRGDGQHKINPHRSQCQSPPLEVNHLWGGARPPSLDQGISRKHALQLCRHCSHYLLNTKKGFLDGETSGTFFWGDVFKSRDCSKKDLESFICIYTVFYSMSSKTNRSITILSQDLGFPQRPPSAAVFHSPASPLSASWQRRRRDAGLKSNSLVDVRL